MSLASLDEVVLFDRQVVVNAVDSSSFDRVSRVRGQAGPSDGLEFVLDVNTEIYPLQAGQRLRCVLASNVEEAQHRAAEDTGVYDPNMRRRKTLLDSFEYAVYGRVFKFEEEKGSNRVVMTASFGGLLLSLKAPFDVFEKITMDLAIYLLLSRC